jgi:hypothetical protein
VNHPRAESARDFKGLDVGYIVFHGRKVSDIFGPT